MSSLAQKGRTPLALFTYNRPQYARLALGTLARCTRIDECQIYIYCDGAKTTEQATAVEQSRVIVRAWAEKFGAIVIERNENLGLARSIATAVTELCEKFGRVIVLEDDLQVSPDFVDYMLQALDRYADESRVYQISGYMFRIKNPAQPDAFFVPLTTSWGWATWNRAWHAFDSDAAAAAVEKLADPQVRRRFDLDNSSDRATMMHQRAVNQNDSWAILWWWAVFQINGLVLYPRKSLVWVGGFDDSGTHNRAASKVHQDDLELFSRNRLSQPIRLPAKIIADDTVFDKIKSFLRKQRKREEQRTLDAYLRRGVKKMFRIVFRLELSRRGIRRK